MVLNMADIVELEFYFLEGQPGKSRFCVQVHRRDLFLDFVFARVEVFENFIFAVRFSDLRFCMRRPGKVAEKLVVLPVLLPRNKLFFRFLQVQVCIEENVVCNMPEFILEVFAVPKRRRAFGDCTSPHLERCIILRFDNVFRVHNR